MGRRWNGTGRLSAESRRRPDGRVGVLVGALVVASAGVIGPSPSPAIAAAGDDLPVVHLTYDDGPAPATGPLLDLLSDHDAHATFFVLGQHVAANPAIVRRTLAEGHAVANHSWSHPELPRLGPSALHDQLRSTNDAIRAVGGAPACFRPPYGATNPRVEATAAALGLTQVLWDIDTRDWEHQSVAAITSHFGSPSDGMVILLHDGGGPRGATLQATAELLDRWKGRAHFEALPQCIAGGGAAGGMPAPEPVAAELPLATGPALGFEPVPATRLLDTRSTSVRVAAGETRVIDPGPVDAAALTLGITVIDAAGDGYVQSWDCGGEPATSVLNMVAGETRAGSAVVALDPSGRFCLRSSVAAHLVVDLTGRLTPSGVRARLTSVRVVDTRAGIPMGRQWRRLDVEWPEAVIAIGAVVTMTGTGSPSDFVSVLPCAEVSDPAMAPPVSAVNGSEPAANFVEISNAGGLCVWSSGGRAVLIDVMVEWGAGDLAYRSVTPTRLLDTRAGTGRRGPVTGGRWNAVAVSVDGERPAGLMGTLTTTDAGGRGYATIGRSSADGPDVSSVQVTSHDTAGATSVDGCELSVFSSVRTQAIFDLTGVFTR